MAGRERWERERERGQYREDGVAEVAVDVANVLRNDLGRHFRVAKGLSAYAKEEEEEEEDEEESSVNL